MASDTRYPDVAAIGRFEAFISSVGGLRKVAARMAVANGSSTPSKDQIELQVRRLTRVSSGSVTMAMLNLIAEAVARPFDELLAMVSHQPDPACAPAATEPDTNNRREPETGSERWRAPETETGRLYQRLNEASDLTASRTNIVRDEPGLPVLTLKTNFTYAGISRTRSRAHLNCAPPSRLLLSSMVRRAQANLAYSGPPCAC